MLFERVSRVELLSNARFLLVSQVIQHLAPLMDLATLDRRRPASVLVNCGYAGFIETNVNFCRWLSKHELACYGWEFGSFLQVLARPISPAPLFRRIG
jgi:hypothetical protein